MLLAISLAHGGLSPARVGIVLAALVAGIALASLLLARYGERVGRRRAYALLLALMAIAGAVFALTTILPLLVLAALTGAISSDVVESGPFTSLEQAMLANEPAATRLRLFGTYNIVATLAGSLGALAAGGPALLSGLIASAPSDQHWLLIYPACAIIALPLALRLTAGVEAPRAARATAPRATLQRSRGIVLRLSGLFAVDSLAGGFVVQAYIAYWLSHRFAASTELIGLVFFAIGILQAASFRAAVTLGNRIGLLNTMVLTHLPSNILLGAIAFAPNLQTAIALLLARFALSQMDLPARQVYVASLVAPDERTAAAAYTNTARYLVRPVGPIASGALLGAGLAGAPFLIAGAAKVAYDLALYRVFRPVPVPNQEPS
ncbi:MAG: MFS transporter [Actinomycetota bacterium]|nr:MFS transporter [Actinomycetota bacterium]